MDSLKDRVVIITGGGSGIGRAAALSLARRGAKVVVTGRRKAPLDVIAAEHPHISGVVADAAAPDHAVRVVEKAIDKWGRLDVLVNNAGAGALLALADASADRITKILDQRTPDDSKDAIDLAGQISINIDEHGSPVSLEAANWLVCFVPGLKKQWWHRFVRGKHKHVFAMRPEPSGLWTLFEPWWRRLLTASLTVEQARKFLTWAATGDVLLVRELIPGNASQIRGWANCAVLVSFLLGRGYWTWTPNGFYRRLTRERGVRPFNVSMLLALETSQLEAASKVLSIHNWDDRSSRMDDGAGESLINAS